MLLTVLSLAIVDVIVLYYHLVYLMKLQIRKASFYVNVAI